MNLTKVFGLILLFATLCLAQETGNTKNEIKWTRIETRDKDLSVSFPPGFLVDAETKEYNQRQRIIGFQNGVTMELTVYEENNPLKRLKNRISSAGQNETQFISNGFTVVSIPSLEEHFSNTLLLASEKNFYRIFISAKNDKKSEIGRFLYSVRLNGKPFYKQKTENAVEPEETVSLLSLKTSPEVLEALNRKTENGKINISYKANMRSNRLIFDDDKYSRPPIILSNVLGIVSNALRPTSSGPRPPFDAGIITFQVSLLANGQVGDVSILATSNRDLNESAIKDFRKIKFLPAQIDGKPVDAQKEVQTEFVSFSAF